jgi:hypothetical protein
MGHSAPDHAGIIVSALVRSASRLPRLSRGYPSRGCRAPYPSDIPVPRLRLVAPSTRSCPENPLG